MRFDSVDAQQILDSRGYPTVTVGLGVAGGQPVRASSPAGASTGRWEAVELRDGGGAYGGRGVTRAVAGVTGPIRELLLSSSWDSARQVDDALRALDGTDTLSRLGANAVVAVSMATARAFAASRNVELHAWVSTETGQKPRLPVPHFNVVNGGAHAPNALDFQEFMIAPVGATSMADAVRCSAEIYHHLRDLLRERGHDTGLGDEGGFAPQLTHPREVLDLLVAAISGAGYTPGVDDVAIALDPAANGFHVDGHYRVAGEDLSSDDLIALYADLAARYPIRSIEDGLAEDDLDGWARLTAKLGDRLQLVGDDLLVTDPERIARAGRDGLGNAALIKPNQIGTVSQTLDALDAARRADFTAMISHRSGETVDTFVADLAVGSGVGQLKSGAPARGERVAKYNRLLSIAAAHPDWAYGLEPASVRPQPR